MALNAFTPARTWASDWAAVNTAGSSLLLSRTPEETTELARPMLAQFREFPHLTELTTRHVLRPGYDFGNEYEFALDLVLDGLERARAAP
jgi:hypothetical protein